MNRDMIMGFIRHLLTFGGGYFVATGKADAATVEQVISGAAALIGIVWSMIDKKQP